MDRSGPGVGDVDGPCRTDGHAGWRVEEIPSRQRRDRAVQFDSPDPIVVGVGNDDSSSGINGDAKRAVELRGRRRSVTVARATITGQRRHLSV